MPPGGSEPSAEVRLPRRHRANSPRRARVAARTPARPRQRLDLLPPLLPPRLPVLARTRPGLRPGAPRRRREAAHPVTAALPETSDEQTWLPVTRVLEHAFCPRYTYYEEVLRIPQRQEIRYKVLEGRKVHARRERTNRGYKRKRLGVIEKLEDVALSSETLRLYGRIDEALRLADGTAAPLDYKFSPMPDKPRDYVVHQATAYALLLEETWGLPVRAAYVYYLREPRGHHRIETTPRRRASTRKLIRAMRSVREQACLPEPTRHRSRCRDCSFRTICPQ
ncbi:MAG: CRISPR-associated protein Cas4 [Planctomycetota bacterium]|nr:MAG: CRISPR-associated protein Cas4 [Planctomycetota bacterium]